MGEFQRRVGPGPRFRYRPGHYGVFAPFVAMFWMVVLLVTVVWFAVKVTVTVIVVIVQAASKASAAASKRSSQTWKG
jgi:hypothetical protein